MSNEETIVSNAHIEQLASLIAEAASKEKLKKCVFSKSRDKSVQKAVLTLKAAKGKNYLQLEVFHKDNKATHKNYDINEDITDALAEAATPFMQINLLTCDGDCEYKCSASGKTVIIGYNKLKEKLSSSIKTKVEITSNNRQKEYILSGNEDFLKYLDVSDKNGRVYDKKQAKFRQINRFLELVRDIEDKLPKDNIRICDLCCGKSYLSFAVYHYFANIKGYSVSMTGVDLKQDVVNRCNDIARSLSFYGLEFICENINKYQPDTLPSLVISLHACDIATDFVLCRAVEWGADVILSTPCCHHELNHNINSDALSFITDYSILRQKLCDAATDALRLCRLEAQGYTTSALELIDPDETPKNIMLRAVRKKGFNPCSKEAMAAKKRYEDAKAFLCGDNMKGDLHF